MSNLIRINRPCDPRMGAVRRIRTRVIIAIVMSVALSLSLTQPVSAESPNNGGKSKRALPPQAARVSAFRGEERKVIH